MRDAGGRAARENRDDRINEVLTIGEIETRFDGEWVLIAEPETDDNLEVLRGRVVSHDRDPEGVYRKAIDQHTQRWASLYFGPVPEHICISLGLFY